MSVAPADAQERASSRIVSERLAVLGIAASKTTALRSFQIHHAVSMINDEVPLPRSHLPSSVVSLWIGPMIAPHATPSWRMGSQPKGVPWSFPPGHRVGSVVGVGSPFAPITLRSSINLGKPARCGTWQRQLSLQDLDKHAFNFIFSLNWLVHKSHNHMDCDLWLLYRRSTEHIFLSTLTVTTKTHWLMIYSLMHLNSMCIFQVIFQ
jgi:hypothetical protein